MAKVFVSEYRVQGKEIAGAVPIAAPQEPALASQAVAIGGTSVQSAAFNAETRFIRVHTDAICSIEIGSNPTATADTKRMAAGATEYFGVAPTHKIAVITNT